MKKLICAKDVESALKQGQKALYADRDTIITPSAIDAACAGGIKFSQEILPQTECCLADQTGCRTDQTGCRADQIDSDMIYTALKMMVAKGMLKDVFDDEPCKNRSRGVNK